MPVCIFVSVGFSSTSNSVSVAVPGYVLAQPVLGQRLSTAISAGSCRADSNKMAAPVSSAET